MMDYFYKGVALFAMTRVTRKRVYLRHAKRCLAVIKKWTERGNPNVAHFERLLQAELLAYQGKIYLAKNAFEAGTVLAARGGFIHDSAFASERFGEFLLEAMGDEENAVYKFKAALSLYEEWGAVAKVEHLRSKYESWLSVPTTIVSLSSFDYTSEAAPLGTDELK